MGQPSFHTFSAAFVYIFRYLLKCCLLKICNKILEKWLYLILDIGKYMKQGSHMALCRALSGSLWWFVVICGDFCVVVCGGS